MHTNSVAVVVGVIIALIILIIGFVFVLQGNQNLSDQEVIQRQLRGFGLIILAPIVGAVIIYLCSL